MALVELDTDSDGLDGASLGWAKVVLRGEDISFLVQSSTTLIGVILRSGADRNLIFASPEAAAAAYGKLKAGM